MRIGKRKYFRKFTVIFSPGEEKEFLDKYGYGRCLSMKARTDLKPWGTREALMEEELTHTGLLSALEDSKEKIAKKFARKKKSS